MKKLFLLAFFGLMTVGASAQRVTDKLDRGIVAVPTSSGTNFVSWRKFGSEYYDTKYNLYRNGTKIAENLEVSNFTDNGAPASATYQVAAVVRGVEQEKSVAVTAWKDGFFDVKVQPVVNRAGKKIGNSVAGNSGGNDTTTSGYTLNDVSLADVDGDGICEFIVKRNNSQGNLSTPSNTTDFNHYECYKIDGTRLWWIDLGPNLMSNPDEQYDMIGYDWDRDGKAECVMRAADNMIIHTASGKTINIGDMTFDCGKGKSSRPEYVAEGAEYLLYLNGATGEPYGWDGVSDSFTPMAFPLPRFESNETVGDGSVWGDVGHRATKIYMGAPYLDGIHASIFFGRGCYTRHKACALDVNPATHELTQRWRWNCYDSKSPWYGNGFHNFAIADVDMDGRDEIVYGSMILDDTGYGLATTGLGHGDAQHCGDLDPYRWGLEQFNCLEGSQGNAYWNATTAELYYRKADGGDDGRALAGNFTNDYPGSQGKSASSSTISLTADKVVPVNGVSNLNMRIYWDGDLLEEMLDTRTGANRKATLYKWNGRQLKEYDAISNNWTKCNPSAQGDILGDWREEVVLRTAENDALRIYTTTDATVYPIYTLWNDHVYRNGMAWQCVGYNQPPHTSFFLGELEGITMAPPPLIQEGRTEVANGGTIATTDDHLLVYGYEDKTISVADGASPYILTVNAPAWVQGSGSQQATAGTPKSPARTVINYTTTLTGGAFSGATRLIKQGEGTLVLPNVVEKHTGETNVWNGTLQFDGTFENSPLWLNRHTTLISNGGQFKKGVKADYNATIYPGGKANVGSISTSELTLGFGSRIVFDVNGSTIDQVDAEKLVVEAKTDQVWLDYGPKYKSPVFQFVGGESLPAGKYQLGAVGAVTGSLSKIVIEGIGSMRASLQVEDGKLYLVLGALREAGSVVWNGTDDNSNWDFGFTENFLVGTDATYFAANDDVTFNDNAASTNVRIIGGVAPKSVTFDNVTKAYTLSGDSIIGAAPIVKNGTGLLTVNNINHSGATTINAGKLSVSLLANKTGQAYGSLGDYKQSVTINDGASLQANGIIITDQPIRANGTVTVEVPTGMTFTTNNGIKGVGAVVRKTGAGTMTLGTGNTFSKLIIDNGRVNANHLNNVDDLPADVVFNNGILWGDNYEDNPGVNNNTNFNVPKGKTGTFYAGYRSVYRGKLTGEGTFNVYTGGIRCYFDGDWSEFAGTIKAYKNNRQNKKSYEPIWAFRNTKGMPNATLDVQNKVRVSNEGKNIALGKLTGNGTLIGSGQWILGGNNDDFPLNTEIGITSARTDDYGETIAVSPSNLTKRGTGKMSILTLGKLNAVLTIDQGTLAFNQASLADFVNGSNATTVNDGGRIVGQGKFSTLTLNSGAELVPCGSFLNETTPGIIKTTAMMTVNEGAVVNFLFKSASQSSLQPSLFTLNGTVKVTLLDGFTPKNGDEFTLWTTTLFKGTPQFDLPELPDGLYWDTTGVAAKKGVLRVTDSVVDGIGSIGQAEQVCAEVYTIGGTFVGTLQTARRDVAKAVAKLGVRPGLYIVKMQAGRNIQTQTVTVR